MFPNKPPYGYIILFIEHYMKMTRNKISWFGHLFMIRTVYESMLKGTFFNLRYTKG